jgi:hypothetical protein
MLNLNNLPKESIMKDKLKEILPKMNKRQKKIVLATIKLMKKTKQISQEQYDDAINEFEKLEGKNGIV